jgi:hypothetical protein
MLASVLIAVAAFFLTASDDPFASKNLQVVLLATAIGLGVMGLWHLVRAPWVLQRRIALNEKEEDDKWGWGLFGSLIVAGILFGGYYGSVRAYRAKIPALVVNIPSADPGAKNGDCLAPERVSEFPFEHRKGTFDIGTLVVMLQLSPACT